MKKTLSLVVMLFLLFSTLAFGLEDKKIALTFDDGPKGKITEELLNILEENNIKATFFILGENGKRYPELLNRMDKLGHQVSNHTYSHPNLRKLSINDVKKQLQETQNIIKKATGKDNKFFRPPYGALSKNQKEILKNEMNLESVMWNICPKDWEKTSSSEYIADFLVKNAKNNGIVLLHDSKKTCEALKVAIPGIKNQGFKFITVEEIEK